MIDWLNQNAGVLALLFSLVVAVATWFYAFLTKKLVDETCRLRRAQTEPRVSVRVENSPTAFGLVDILVENVGVGPAYEIRFDIVKELDVPRFGPVSQLGFVRNGIRYLAPHQRIGGFLISLIGAPNEKLEGSERLEFAIRASYRDSSGKEYSELFAIDFAHYVALSTVGTPPLEAINKSLVEIKRSIEKLSAR